MYKMSHDEKINWMIHWCHEQTVRLTLREEFVGIYCDHSGFVTYDCADANIWSPPGARIKPSQVFIVEGGKEAEDRLYQWLRWFETHDYVVERGVVPIPFGASFDVATLVRGEDRYVRMVNKPGAYDG